MGVLPRKAQLPASSCLWGPPQSRVRGRLNKALTPQHTLFKKGLGALGNWPPKCHGSEKSKVAVVGFRSLRGHQVFSKHGPPRPLAMGTPPGLTRGLPPPGLSRTPPAPPSCPEAASKSGRRSRPLGALGDGLRALSLPHE